MSQGQETGVYRLDVRNQRVRIIKQCHIWSLSLCYLADSNLKPETTSPLDCRQYIMACMGSCGRWWMGLYQRPRITRLWTVSGNQRKSCQQARRKIRKRQNHAGSHPKTRHLHEGCRGLLGQRMFDMGWVAGRGLEALCSVQEPSRRVFLQRALVA